MLPTDAGALSSNNGTLYVDEETRSGNNGTRYVDEETWSGNNGTRYADKETRSGNNGTRYVDDAPLAVAAGALSSNNGTFSVTRGIDRFIAFEGCSD